MFEKYILATAEEIEIVGKALRILKRNDAPEYTNSLVNSIERLDQRIHRLEMTLYGKAGGEPTGTNETWNGTTCAT